MKVVDLEQRTDEWLEWRADGVSATSCAIIMGENPDKTPLMLWRELVGLDERPDLSCIPQVRKGVKYEPLALKAFEDKYGQLGLPICAESSVYPFIRASFDGLLENGTPAEIKNLSDDNHLDVLQNGVNSKPYRLYRWQVLHQLIVSDAPRGYLWFWSPKHSPALLVVERDDLLIQRIIQAEQAFWNLVQTATPPAPDTKRDLIPHSMLDLNRWKQLAADRRNHEIKLSEAKKKLDGLQDEAKGMEQEFIEMMGDFQRADAFGVRVTRYERDGRVNWQGVAESLNPVVPEELVAKFRAMPTMSTRMTVNSGFDESSYKPEQAPTPRRLQGQMEAQSPFVAGVFNF